MADITLAEVPRIISVDDHVIEPPTLWTTRLPAKYRDVGPHVVESKGRGELRDGKFVFVPDQNGRRWDVWHFEDMTIPLHGIELSAETRVVEDGYPKPVTYDTIRPGCYEQKARLRDMDINGVEASINFPNMVVRFAGQLFLEANDKQLALLALRAYNDWVLEEWCAGSGGRLIPLCVVPLWDPLLAAEEVRRVAALGCKAIAFTEQPPYLGLPSIHTLHWDPLFAACEEVGSVVNVHIGSGSKFFTTSADAPVHTMEILSFVNPAMSITDWIFSGVLQRFPRLRVAFAESQIGWLPYVLERMDRTWEHFPDWGWAGGRSAAEALPERPSFYFRRNCLCAFFEDPHGVRSIEEIGFDNVAFETDYPHSDGTWPNSLSIANEMLKELDAVTARKIIRGNAIRFFDLDLK